MAATGVVDHARSPSHQRWHSGKVTCLRLAMADKVDRCGRSRHRRKHESPAVPGACLRHRPGRHRHRQGARPDRFRLLFRRIVRLCCDARRASRYAGPRASPMDRFASRRAAKPVAARLRAVRADRPFHYAFRAMARWCGGVRICDLPAYSARRPRAARPAAYSSPP
jgi:hypothetical protein